MFDFSKLDSKKFSEAFSGLETEYEEFIEIPSEKKRVMMSSDYSILLTLDEVKKDD